MFDLVMMLIHERKDPSFLVLTAVVLIFAFRKEIGGWLLRR
jgi:hypothetical protein